MHHQNYISGYQERVRSSIKRSPTGAGIRCCEGCTTVCLFLDALTEELLGWGVFRCIPRWVDVYKYLHCSVAKFIPPQLETINLDVQRQHCHHRECNRSRFLPRGIQQAITKFLGESLGGGGGWTISCVQSVTYYAQTYAHKPSIILKEFL